MRDWCDVAGSFIPAGDDTELRRFILPVRYEDLTAQHRGWTGVIAQHCELDATMLDESVFGVRVHTVGPHGRSDRPLRDWRDLPPPLRALLDDDELRSVASAYGYDL